MAQKDYERAARIVLGIKTGVHAPLCAWQTREAFVGFFAGRAEFDADTFREMCGDIAKSYRPILDRSMLTKDELVHQEMYSNNWIAQYKGPNGWIELASSPFCSENDAVRALINSRE